MVAYGVLEMKPKDGPHPARLFSGHTDEEVEAERKANYERDQLRKLVRDELNRYGLLLTRKIEPKGAGWRTRHTAHILYGQLVKSGFGTREVLHEGDFKDCCIAAAKILDDLDRSQAPDGQT
jgi:hypothetical protein